MPYNNAIENIYRLLYASTAINKSVNTVAKYFCVNSLTSKSRKENNRLLLPFNKKHTTFRRGMMQVNRSYLLIAKTRKI